MESYIQTGKGGTAFVGPDATAMFAAIALKHGLQMYAKFKMVPNRNWTPPAMLKAASGYTGKAYKRGQHALAAADVQIWIDAMRAALPIVED
jgi:hypothetical protein